MCEWCGLKWPHYGLALEGKRRRCAGCAGDAEAWCLFCAQVFGRVIDTKTLSNILGTILSIAIYCHGGSAYALLDAIQRPAGGDTDMPYHQRPASSGSRYIFAAQLDMCIQHE